MRSPLLTRAIALATIAATLVLLVIGGLVHGTGSGMACPETSFVPLPLCQGELLPEMVGGVLYEHGHRLWAAGVGCLTILLAFAAWRSGRARALAIGAVVLVTAQGLLGRITVLYNLPSAVSIAHLGTSMVFFGLLVVIAHRARPVAAPLAQSSARPWAVLGMTAVYLQILLGAAVRHLEAGMSCLDLPFCRGDLWPEGFLPQVHMAHRIFACVAAAATLTAAWKVWRAAEPGTPARRMALAMPFLLAGQITLGVLSVQSMLGLYQVTAHLAGGAVLLAAMVSLVLHTAGSGSVSDLIALVKPRITILSVLTAACGLWLAPGTAGATVTWTTLLGTLLLVGSANTLNMYLERDVDALMARTRRRPLPAGRMAPGVALAFGLLQAAVAVPVMAFGAGLLTGVLGAIALVLYVLVYTPLKRKTTWSLLIGAIPGAMPPLLGWTAATGRVDLAGLALFGVIFVWQVPHFLAIALFQRDDYRAAGLKVMPLVAGETRTKHAIVVTLVLQALVTLALVPLGVGGTGYLVGAILLGAGMLAWGVLGLRTGAGRGWARGLFLASILYLPILFGLMFV